MRILNTLITDTLTFNGLQVHTFSIKLIILGLDDGAYISFASGYINIYVPEIYTKWYPKETGACTESPALFSNHIVHGGIRDFFSKNYRKNSTLVDVPPYFLCKGRAPVTKTVHSAIPFFTPT